MVTVLSTAALLLSQGTSFAAGGNWHFGPASTVAAGSTTSWSPPAFCGEGPCSYSADWHLNMSAHNGAYFTNSAGSSFALVKGSTGAQVGTCNVTSSTEVDCKTNSSGSIENGDRLRPGQNIILRAATTTCTDTAEATWSDTSGASGNEDDDFQTVTTGGACG